MSYCLDSQWLSSFQPQVTSSEPPTFPDLMSFDDNSSPISSTQSSFVTTPSLSFVADGDVPIEVPGDLSLHSPIDWDIFYPDTSQSSAYHLPIDKDDCSTGIDLPNLILTLDTPDQTSPVDHNTPSPELLSPPRPRRRSDGQSSPLSHQYLLDGMRQLSLQRSRSFSSAVGPMMQYSPNFSLSTLPSAFVEAPAHSRPRTSSGGIVKTTVMSPAMREASRKRARRPGMHNCDICNHMLTTKAGLRNHKRSHYGEKPFKCELCEKHFITDWDRKRHQRNVHTSQSGT